MTVLKQRSSESHLNPLPNQTSSAIVLLFLIVTSLEMQILNEQAIVLAIVEERSDLLHCVHRLAVLIH